MPKGSPKRPTCLRLDPVLVARVMATTGNLTAAVEEGLRRVLASQEVKSSDDFILDPALVAEVLTETTDLTGALEAGLRLWLERRTIATEADEVRRWRDGYPGSGPLRIFTSVEQIAEHLRAERATKAAAEAPAPNVIFTGTEGDTSK